MSPEFMKLHSQYIDKFGDGFNTVVMSDDEEKASNSVSLNVLSNLAMSFFI
jgi:hypothetical protein